MRISHLYQNLFIKNDHKISQITDNSKDIIPGSIFVALPGYRVNGATFIEEAIKKGALTIITNNNYQTTSDVNVIVVENPKKELAILLHKVYYKRLKNFKIIGITGTNGKTTCCNLLYKYLLFNKLDVICFSSNGNYVNHQYFKTNNTTPNITTIYNTILNSKLTKGYIIIEISSQAISELRVFGLSFDLIVITNITQDHLDYHKNLTDYFYTKASLIYQIKKDGSLLINRDSKYYEKLNKLSPVKTYTFGPNENSDFYYEIVESTINNTLFFVNTNYEINAFETPLIGNFNVQNIAIVYSILSILNISLNNFKEYIKNVERVDGRMNVYNVYGRTIIIDYAHTPKAVEASLETIKNMHLTSMKLIIGCGGNRDRLKRPIIGKLACQYADFVYFTEDNSRNEETEKIIKEMTCDLTKNNYTIIESRLEAIKKAIKDSKPSDVIILMGKGTEKTKVEEMEYTDLEMVLKSFRERQNVS